MRSTLTSSSRLGLSAATASSRPTVRRVAAVVPTIPSRADPRRAGYSTTTPLSPSATASQVDVPFAHPTDSIFRPLDTFEPRHIGPRDADTQAMLSTLGYESMEAFVGATVPDSIRIKPLTDEDIRPLSELELLRRAQRLAAKNKPMKSYIGTGYTNAIVPPVIQRNVLENPAWYTAYTPYSPEQSQGRLESLINFQTMVISLTGLPMSNASLLDEATAAAEGMAMCLATAKIPKGKTPTFLVSQGVSQASLAVLRTRGKGFGVEIKSVRDDEMEQALSAGGGGGQGAIIGCMLQYPDVDGGIKDYASVSRAAKAAGAKVVVASDLLALTMLKPPGEWGADIVLGNSARFGVPAGYGGPHAAFFSCTEALKRKMPGRLVGLSKDTRGHPAYRLALQTREQHIRREKATSNVCTSQALLANMAAMYAVYHGPEGLRRIAGKVNALTAILKAAVVGAGFKVVNEHFFDTLTIDVGNAERMHEAALAKGINLRRIDASHVGVTLDESVGLLDLTDIVNVFTGDKYTPTSLTQFASQQAAVSSANLTADIATAPSKLARRSPFLEQKVFNSYHSETEMLRYLYSLQEKDFSLVHGMIPLGSCTMKLNSTSSMTPLSWKEFGGVHPFAPVEQNKGYAEIIKELEDDLALITGFDATSLQPNSGASGEYAGLSVIKAYLESTGQGHRDICLIPVSAHGTNPASAFMAGMKVVAVKTLQDGSLDLEDLRTKATKHKDQLAAFMVTYPSTYGVFEEGVSEACQIIHDNGGQVYLDGANLNAQIGLTNPGTCGADVCHLNLHKTFGIPHGGGGPGIGPICVRSHLAPFLPGHPLIKTGGDKAINAVAAAPWGSASIATISWAYIKMLGGKALTNTAQMALLNANYIAARLNDHYTIKYTNKNGRVAHELLIDFAEFEKTAGLKAMDWAKRLQDYSFHPPTISWPISSGCLIEPTESESKAELDKFCDAMIAIRGEVQEIIDGKQAKDNNTIKNAPHPVDVISASEWTLPYSREKAAYPLPYLRQHKFWPTTTRIDDAFGDLNLICTCEPMSSYADEEEAKLVIPGGIQSNT